jgi:hypothetical protein
MVNCKSLRLFKNGLPIIHPDDKSPCCFRSETIHLGRLFTKTAKVRKGNHINEKNTLNFTERNANWPGLFAMIFVILIQICSDGKNPKNIW